MHDPKSKNTVESDDSQAESESGSNEGDSVEQPKEIGGRGGLDPTRYGDWEKAGRCIDF